MKKFFVLCAFMFVALGVYAQSSSADELLKWKELYDSGVISEAEFNAKKEQIVSGTSATYSSNTAQSTSSSSVYLKPDDAYQQIDRLLEDDLFDNAERIKALSGNLTPAQKNELYEQYSKSAGGYFALNLFLGFGIGSFAQGDKRDGWSMLGFELGGITLLTTGLLSSGTSATTLVAMGSGFMLGAAISGCITPWIYSNTRNDTLKQVLGMSGGVAIVPIIDPVDQNYGLLAQIQF